MANLSIEVKLDKGAERPLVAIDGTEVVLDSDGKGTAQVNGTKGDGSNHNLIVSFEGPKGATLGITVACSGDTLCEIKAVTIQASNEPYGGTHRIFKL